MYFSQSTKDDTDAMNASLRERIRLRRLIVPPATQQELTPGRLQQALRISILEGAFANIHISVTMGAFLTGFALLLGANNVELGLIAAAPFIGQFFQYAGAYLENVLGSRRQLTVWSAGVSRALWALAAALPFFPALRGAQLGLFLAILLLSQGLLAIGVNAWTSWMSDLVPARRRGRYFGIRNTVLGITAMGSSWLAGRTIDHYRLIGDEKWGYALVFGVAVVCALISSVILSYQAEPPVQRRGQAGLGALLITPIRLASFRSFVFAATAWALATGIASPFFNAHGIQHLHLPFATQALFAVVASAGGLITQPFIGRLQDRYGSRAVLIGSALGTVFLPWGWILATPDNILPVWITHIFTGCFWPGVTQGLLNLLMERAPAEGRGAYVASYGAITGIGTFTASLLGGLLATALAPYTLDLGVVTLVNYSMLFVMTSILRALVVIWFAKYM